MNGGPAGDLYVVIKVKDHPIFERQGDDLHCTVPINVAQAALGNANRSAHFRWPGNGQSARRAPERRAHPAQNLGVPRLQGSGRGRSFRPHRRPGPGQTDPRAAQPFRISSATPCRPKTSRTKKACSTKSKTTSCDRASCNGHRVHAGRSAPAIRATSAQNPEPRTSESHSSSTVHFILRLQFRYSAVLPGKFCCSVSLSRSS